MYQGNVFDREHDRETPTAHRGVDGRQCSGARSSPDPRFRSALRADHFSPDALSLGLVPSRMKWTRASSSGARSLRRLCACGWVEMWGDLAIRDQSAKGGGTHGTQSTRIACTRSRTCTRTRTHTSSGQRGAAQGGATVVASCADDLGQPGLRAKSEGVRLRRAEKAVLHS